MTTATAPDVRAELEARWMAVSTGMTEQREANGRPHYTLDNARDWYKIERILQRWAVVVYGDHIADEDGAIDTMDAMTGSIHEFIHKAIVDWAEARQAESAEYWARRAAEKVAHG